MKMDQAKIIKIAGVTGTILSVGATVLSSWVEDKKLNERVEKEVAKVLEKQLKDLGNIE